MKRVIIAVVVIAAVGGGVWKYKSSGSKSGREGRAKTVEAAVGAIAARQNAASMSRRFRSRLNQLRAEIQKRISLTVELLIPTLARVRHALPN